ncbi:hypothetical protein MMPV_006087 [Pyropia vietnamensis]
MAGSAAAPLATANAVWGGDGLLSAGSADTVEVWTPGAEAAADWAGRLAAHPSAAAAESLRGQLARLGVSGVRLGGANMEWAVHALLGGARRLPLCRVALHGDAFRALVDASPLDALLDLFRRLLSPANPPAAAVEAGEAPSTDGPAGGESPRGAFLPAIPDEAAAAATTTPSLPPTLEQLSLNTRGASGSVPWQGRCPLCAPWVSEVALPPLPSLRVLAVAADGLSARALAPIGIHFPALVTLTLTGSVREDHASGAFAQLAVPALPALAHLHLGLCHCPPSAKVRTLYTHRRLTSLDPAYDDGEDLTPVVADVASVAALPAALTVSALDVDTGGAVLALRHHPHPETLVALRVSLNAWGEVGRQVAAFTVAFPALTSLGIDLYGDGSTGEVTWPPSHLTRLSLWVHDDEAIADGPVAAVAADASTAASLTHLAVEADTALTSFTVRALRRLRRLKMLALRARHIPATTMLPSSPADTRLAYEQAVRAATAATAVSVSWDEDGTAAATTAA